ncbi:MAG: methionyl-tRNA formyltransferase [Clostridiales bacterium]|nr:methionyl-tRNA formyltransferase [Clostridiales bacterium]
MRVVFLGSPQFAVPSLLALVKAGHTLAGVVTQPDKPGGRGGRLAATPVKETALALGLPLLQPSKVNQPEAVAAIRAWQPDVLAVTAFGQILREELLTLAPKGAVNVHGSLLPAYRGAAPIHWAVIRGERVTGITTMYMDKGMDTGNMIFKRELPILPQDDCGSLYEKLSLVGAELLVQTLEAMALGNAPSIPQDNTLATYAPLLKKEHEVVDWQADASAVHNHIRGMSPWPGAYTVIGNKRLKLWQSKAWPEGRAEGRPGEIAALPGGEGVFVKCGSGLLELLQVQPEAGKKMLAADWARGYGVRPGAVLGENLP